MVDQVADLFRTTHKVKTQHVVKIRGHHCGDIQLEGYLANETGPVSLVLDLRIAHDRVGSSTDPNLNGHLKYPNNFDQSLNDAAADKVRKYRADYNNRSPSVVSFIPDITSTSDRLHSEFVRLLFLQAHRETDRFFAASGVLSAQSDRGLYHLLHAVVSAQLKSKVGLTLAKTAALRITLNLDGAPIIRTHTHPSHSQTSRLLTSSLFLGVPVPRATQCMRGFVNFVGFTVLSTCVFSTQRSYPFLGDRNGLSVHGMSRPIYLYHVVLMTDIIDRQWRTKEDQSGLIFPVHGPHNSTWTKGGDRYQGVNLDFQRHPRGITRSQGI
jgi:hypothetical protein